MSSLRPYRFILACVFAAFLQANAQAQINMPRPSPNASVSQSIGLAEVKIAYSRPQIKGRKIFGGLVPFDKIWRTGANAPTKVSITDTVLINGKKIAPGDYGLYTIPGAAAWTIILGKNPNTNADDYKDDQEVIRFTVKPEVLPAPVEAFTIGFVNASNSYADLEISWEKTAVKFRIVNEFDAKVMAQINEKIGVDAMLYFQAASYYFETNRDLNKALEWVTLSTDKKPQFFTLYLKAQIQQKLKDCKGATITALQSMELAKKANNDQYVKFNEKLISDCGIKK